MELAEDLQRTTTKHTLVEKKLAPVGKCSVTR